MSPTRKIALRPELPRVLCIGLSLAIAIFCLSIVAAKLHGGGVLYVAGVSGFDPNVAGKPITWANGNIVYFTDQGDAGAMLPQATANAFVADALSRWTSVSTAALIATRGGSLAEDVNGTNVTNTQDGISLPLDIQPTATSKPLAIVYDNDGQVTDALFGIGASDPTLCATNSVAGGADRFSTDAHIIHALIIINGRCAQNAADLPPLKYQLIRVLGRTLGLDWSQANDNVRSGSPFPSSEDVAGFPLMHPVEPFCISAVTNCISNADQLRMDDRAAISRLYPITQQNISSFPGKQLFAPNTIRIHGSIYFSDVHGNPGQPMQGVNVVARLIDPATGQPSRRYVATSVSGFLFRGNAGNRVSGFGVNQRFDAFGSSDTAMEGFYDLGGLELPNGQLTANYQITLEPIDPLYSGESSVGPYASGSVSPSGTAPAMIVANLTAGSDVSRDIVMTGGARLPVDSMEHNSFATPSPVPRSGQWWGSLSGYGDEDFFTFAARANRTFSLQVTALNENLLPTSGKAQPELGLWLASDPSTVQVVADAFNGPRLGLTELAAGFNTGATFKIGIADYRGDGRPDFLYRARVLYADTVSPGRINTGGVPIAVRGIGFRRGMTINVGATPANIVAVEENQIVLTAPSLNSGSQDISISDPATGAATVMTGALTFGLLNGDHPIIVSSSNPATAVGADAPNAIVVRAVAADGTTPLSGVDLTFSVTPLQSQFPVCASSSCTVVTDANGEASAILSVKSSGSNTVTASLANGAHANTTIIGTSSLTLAAVKPTTLLLAGSSTSVPLSVKLLSGGSPINGQQVSFIVTAGSGTLSNASVATGANGVASISLNLINFTNNVNVTACVPNIPCAILSVLPASLADIKLQKVSGDGQLLFVGQNAQPLLLRVTDSFTPPNAVPNIPVTVTGTVFSHPGPADCNPSDGVCRPAANNFVSRFATTLMSDANGIVSFTPTLQVGWGSVQVAAIATAGDSAVQSFGLQVISPQP